jgi:hypothetical protein
VFELQKNIVENQSLKNSVPVPWDSCMNDRLKVRREVEMSTVEPAMTV